MVKFLALMLLGYFIFRLMNRVLLSMVGPEQSEKNWNGKEKDISDRARIIKD